jgi:hypothetical protein
MKIFPFLCVLNQTNKSMHSTFKATIPPEDKGPTESVQEGWLLHRLSSKTIQQHAWQRSTAVDSRTFALCLVVKKEPRCPILFWNGQASSQERQKRKGHRPVSYILTLKRKGWTFERYYWKEGEEIAVPFHAPVILPQLDLTPLHSRPGAPNHIIINTQTHTQPS